LKWFFNNPYISYINNKEHISLDYALFRNQNVAQDGGFLYANLLDASVDAFAYAMEREGFQGIKIVVSETGWATGGGEAASVANAMAYNENVVRRVANYVGTPRQPNEEMEVYLFDLFDENEKNGEEFT
jgi:exo-beta-1,3-glucanase (GH17 family)